MDIIGTSIWNLSFSISYLVPAPPAAGNLWEAGNFQSCLLRPPSCIMYTNLRASLRIMRLPSSSISYMRMPEQCTARAYNHCQVLQKFLRRRPSETTCPGPCRAYASLSCARAPLSHSRLRWMEPQSDTASARAPHRPASFRLQPRPPPTEAVAFPPRFSVEPLRSRTSSG